MPRHADPAPQAASEGRQTEPCTFVIFGVTGDLAARKLVPALWALHREGRLHEDTQIVGYARSERSDTQLRDDLHGALETYVGQVDASEWSSFAPRIRYVRGGYGDKDGHTQLLDTLDSLGHPRRLFYTATPPETYEGIVSAMVSSGLAAAPTGGWTRLVIEKPFGHDTDSARRLNDVISEAFNEDQIYRIDHYLAKETAQNIAVLRFANALFEPIWSNKYVDHVQISMMEPMGVEGRGAFYEAAGVVRDVFQNHLLQLIALVAMEPPSRWHANAVRDEKVKVFDAFEAPTRDDVVFGQYDRHGDASGYRDEDGVDPQSNQATYAAVRFNVNNWRWSGVPFYVRSGKRMGAKTTEIVLNFKKPPHVPFPLKDPLKADRLVLRVNPNEGIQFVFNAKQPGQGTKLGRVSLDFAYEGRFDRSPPDAYETLLLDAMLGDATLFMRADEIEAQWRIVEPLLNGPGPMADPHFYPAGTSGPAAAERLLEADGHAWHDPTTGT